MKINEILVLNNTAKFTIAGVHYKAVVHEGKEYVQCRVFDEDDYMCIERTFFKGTDADTAVRSTLVDMLSTNTVTDISNLDQDMEIERHPVLDVLTIAFTIIVLFTALFLLWKNHLI